MKPATCWLSRGPNWKHCRSPRVFQIRLVRKASRVVVAQRGAVATARRHRSVWPPANSARSGAKRWPCTRAPVLAGQPGLEILEQLGEALEDRIAARRSCRSPSSSFGKPALHVEARPAPGPPLHRLGEDAVDLARVRLGARSCRRRSPQEAVGTAGPPGARSCARRSSPTGAEAAGDRRRRCAACPGNRTWTASATGFRSRAE